MELRSFSGEIGRRYCWNRGFNLDTIDWTETDGTARERPIPSSEIKNCEAMSKVYSLKITAWPSIRT